MSPKTGLILIIVALWLTAGCSKPSIVPPPAGTGPNPPDSTTTHTSTAHLADSLVGYYVVSEVTTSGFGWDTSVSFVFAAQIKKLHDSAIEIIQEYRSPLTYWSYDYALGIHSNDSLTNPPVLIWGRVVSDSAINVKYMVGSGFTTKVYIATQQWKKLKNPADTALYRFKDTVRNKIITIAGSTYIGSPTVAATYGDGGQALNANLSAPMYVITDAQGNIYVCDNAHNTVRKIGTNGIISLVAGNYTRGYSGDGGLATSAQLNFPNGLALDQAGNIYISDNYNKVIRKVDHSTGIITTFAGTGVSGYSGDSGPATQARLNNPAGMVCDANGNLYVADIGANVIRRISPAGIITTVAGTGVSGYSGDSGPATQAQLNNPGDVRFDAQGNLYIADGGNGEIRMVNPSGIITLFAGNRIPSSSPTNGDGGSAISADIAPGFLAIDSNGVVYLTNGYRVRKITKDGIINSCAGSWMNYYYGYGAYNYCGDYGPALRAAMTPSGLALDRQGNLLIADAYNERIRKVFYP